LAEIVAVAFREVVVDDPDWTESDVAFNCCDAAKEQRDERRNAHKPVRTMRSEQFWDRTMSRA